MKTKIILIKTIFFLFFLNSNGQNIINYETKTVTIDYSFYNYTGIGGFLSLTVDKGRFVSNSRGGYHETYIKGYEFDNNYDAVFSFKNCEMKTETAIQFIVDEYNKNGYSLKSVVNFKTPVPNSPTNYGGEKIILIFEKAKSYREEELYKLLGELNTKIDSTSKSYIELAKTEINQDVLNYLKEIPNEVLAKSFKDELLKNLEIKIEEKLSKMKEAIILELKNNPK